MVFLEAMASKHFATAGLFFMSSKIAPNLPTLPKKFPSIPVELLQDPRVVISSMQIPPTLLASISNVIPDNVVQFAHKGSEIATDAFSVAKERIEISCSNVMTYFKAEANEDGEHEEKSGFPYYVPIGMTLLAAADIYMGGVLLHSIPFIIDVPLKKWIVGGLLLSYPASMLVDRVAKTVSFRAGFQMETALSVAAFVWLAKGTSWVSSSSLAMINAPLLWWSCYLLCVLCWSALGTLLFFMIFTTVLSIVYGGSQLQT